MKKLLLSLLAVAGLSFAASAETTTFTKVTSDDQLVDGAEYVILSCPKLVGKVQYGPFAMAAAKSNKAGFSTYEVEADVTDLAASYDIDKSNITTITLEKATDGWNLKSGDSYINTSTVKKMQLGTTATTFTITTSADNTTFKYSGGSIRATHSNGTGGVKGTVTINTYVSGQNDVVLYKAETTPVNPDLQPAGLKYETTSYTAELGKTFTAPQLTKATTAAVAYSSSDEAVATVDETTGNVTLVGLGTTVITAEAEANTEYRAGKASYTLTVVKSYNTVAEFYTVGANNKGLIGFDLIVTYVNGANCYAQTEDGEATLIYGSTSYEVGDIIPAGWEGQYAPFNGLDEIKPVGTMPAASGTTTFVPAEVTSVSKADMNRVVVLKNVKFDEATASGSTKANFDGAVGDVTYTFRNNFTDVASVEAGMYDVKLAVSYYVDKNNNETLQLYPIEYTAVTETGINGVVVDENAPVEYYNLQGVRVANPENGLYIRRQGNKATKVLVK